MFLDVPISTKNIVKDLALAYQSRPHHELTQYMRDSFCQWIKQLYTHIPFVVKDVAYEPYISIDEMLERVHDTGILLVSSLHNDSPIMGPAVNLMFRAVHDYHHLTSCSDFTFYGEWRAFNSMAHTTNDPHFRAILFSEVVLQAAYFCHFGDFSPKQKLVFLEGLTSTH